METVRYTTDNWTKPCGRDARWSDEWGGAAGAGWATEGQSSVHAAWRMVRGAECGVQGAGYTATTEQIRLTGGVSGGGEGGIAGGGSGEPEGGGDGVAEGGGIGICEGGGDGNAEGGGHGGGDGNAEGGGHGDALGGGEGNGEGGGDGERSMKVVASTSAKELPAAKTIPFDWSIRE